MGAPPSDAPQDTLFLCECGCGCEKPIKIQAGSERGIECNKRLCPECMVAVPEREAVKCHQGCGMSGGG